MDTPLRDLCKQLNFPTIGDHEWPPDVDKDINEFIKSEDPSSIFVVEQRDGLVIGPPPKDHLNDLRVLAISKPINPISNEFLNDVVLYSSKLNDPSVLHTLIQQILIPLFDSFCLNKQTQSGQSTRRILVDAERALLQFSNNHEIPFVDLLNQKELVETALQKEDEKIMLNELQVIFNQWKNEISLLTSSYKTMEIQSASMEVNFWQAFEQALKNAVLQTKSELFLKVKSTLELQKRFQATHNFELDTGLQQTLSMATQFNQTLFKDIPLGEMLAANSIPKLSEFGDLVMQHILRKLRTSNYPLNRSILFVEQINADFTQTLRNLTESKLSEIIDLELGGYTTACKVMEMCLEVQSCCENFDLVLRDFSTLVRELLRKRSEKFSIVRLKQAHAELVSKVLALHALCAKHFELCNLVPKDSELNNVFLNLIAEPKLLRLDTARWHSLESSYLKVAHDAEMDIAMKFRQQLQLVQQNENELLQVFKQHFKVLTRPQVRAVAHEFQIPLISKAKMDLVSAIQRSAELNKLDLDIIEKVLKMKQLKLRVLEITDRMQVVLGKDWREHSDGAQIDMECDKLEEILQIDLEVKKWCENIMKHANIDFNSPIFKSVRGKLEVSALYGKSSSHFQLQTLKALGFRFDLETVQSAERLADLSSAVSRLVDAVSTLNSSIMLLEKFPRLNSVPDVMEHGQRIMSYIRMGLKTINFGSDGLYQFVTGFEHAVNLLDYKVTQLMKSDLEVSEVLENSSQFNVVDLVSKINEILDNSVGNSIGSSMEYSRLVRVSVEHVVSKNICKQLIEFEPQPSEHRIEIRSQQVRIIPNLNASLALWYGTLNQILSPALNGGVLSLETVRNEYTSALKRVSVAWDDAQQYFNVWKQLQPLFELKLDTFEVDAEQSEFEVLGQWFKYLNDLVEARRKLLQSTSVHKYLILDTTDARKQLDERHLQWFTLLSGKLVSSTFEVSTQFMLKSRKIRRELEQQTLSVSSLLKSLQSFNNAKQLLTINTNEWLPLLLKANNLIKNNKIDTSNYAQWYSTSTLEIELQNLEQVCSKTERDLQQAKPQILAELEQTTAIKVVDVEQFRHRWQANRPLQAQVEPNVALQILNSFEAELTDLKNGVKSISECFVSLELPLPSSLSRVMQNLDSWFSELEMLKLGWSDLSRCWQELNALGSTNFFKIDKDVLLRLSLLETELLEDLPARTKQLQNYSKLESLVQKIYLQLPQLKHLQSSSAIKTHHLQQLVPQCSNKPTLKELWTQLPNIEIIQQVVELAEGEYQLLRYLDQLDEKWKSMVLVGMKLNGEGHALQNMDLVLTLANDNLAAMQGMRASPHFKSVSSLVHEWENKLGLCKKLFDKFVDAQQQFLYLRGVLTSKSVALVLPLESKRFKSVQEEFMQLYFAAVGKPALEFATSNPRLESNLQRVINQFASLHRSLTGFMETQRKRFPRLYFIGDDELLEIVGNDLDVWGFKHLPSLFNGVGNLKKVENGMHLVLSQEGEHIVEIQLPANLQDNVELLINLEKQLKQSLKKCSLDAINELDGVWPDPQKFSTFITRFPLQAVLLAVRERWSRTSNTKDHQMILQWLSSAGDDTPLWMRRREVLVAELTHQLETPPSKLLVNVNRDNDNIVVKCGPLTLDYGFDCVLIEPVVRTQVTDELFLSACSSIAQNKGGSVVGPAGTGKTESVKSLGTVFGRQVQVFNCDDEFDVLSVNRIMNGCALTKSWACFDEFNRLSRKVLSSVAHTVSQSVRKTPVFVTMNPGYAGRTVLPPNMREEFKEFILSKPDAQKISRVLLFAHGKVSTAVADAVVDLLAHMAANASNEIHYDWGLRALKGVLRICRQLNGDMRRACEVAIRPKLMPVDLHLFDSEILKIPFSSEHTTLPEEDFTSLQVSDELRNHISTLNTFIHLFAGVMLLGPSSSLKTTCWRKLAEHLNAEVVNVNASSVSKHVILGKQDPLTREWTDGLLSNLLRRVNNNLKGEKLKQWFVVFNGEVEPQWAESLNSVLDDNRQLTLSSGEVLSLPQNVHLIFEVTNLNAATPATVSRCGMICLHNQYTTTEINDNLVSKALEIKHAMNFMPIQAQNTLSHLDLGSKYLSLAWALAGDSDLEGRLQMSDAIRQFAKQENVELPKGNLLTYYISDLTGQWHSFEDAVEVVELSIEDVLKPDVVVPTADTAAHEALLQQALLHHQPLLLVGPPGSGKTMTLFNALRQTPQISLISLNFSSTASPELVIQALEMHCEYSLSSDGTKVLSPSTSNWAALFIDEINLPQPNTNGVVKVIQFLHFLVEYGGFYNSNAEFVKVERVQIVGACNPPPQRRELPPSLLRHFMVVNVDYPSNQSLKTVYSTFMSTFNAEHLVPLMLQVYAELPKLANNEIWTPRELTRWMRSIYTAYNHTNESQRSQKLLSELFVYEGCRVIGDRLETTKQSEVNTLLSTVAQCELSPNLVWSNYLTKRPKFIDIDALREFLFARLPVFVDEVAGEGDRSLVMHDDFIKLVAKVDRILKQPQGHGIIVGPASVGKTTAIRFACWASGLDLRMLKIHSQYGEHEFVNDLRSVLISTIRRPLCFVLSEDMLRVPEFVERMNSLLANGEVPGLFLQEHLAELEDACKRAGYTPQNNEDLNAFFKMKIVSNLHVLFTTTTTSEASPALLNRCTVISVGVWSHKTKQQIAMQWCSTTDVGNVIVDLLTALPLANGREFIELCYQFSTVYTQRKQQLEDTQRHFITGINTLKEALLEIVHLKRHLATQQQKLETEDAHSQTVLQQMLTEQSEAERKRAAAVEIRSAVQHQNDLIQQRKQAANNDLAAAEPLIQQAAQGVQNIKKAHLNELRSLVNPPEPVKITLEAVCMLLGLKTDGTWRQVLNAVRGDEFITRIVNFDTNTLLSPTTAKFVSRIEHDYMSLPSFTFERVDRASKAGGPLFKWVVAQVAYARALSAVKPLLIEIESLNTQSVESQAKLTALESMLEELESAIDLSKQEYSKTVAQCEVLKADMHSVKSQLSRAETLLASLNAEQERWKLSSQEFPEHMARLSGDALVESVELAVCGKMDLKERDNMLNLLKTESELHQIKLSDLILTKPFNRAQIANLSHSIPLIIDPSNSWEKEALNGDADVKLTSFLLTSDALLKELDTALRFGQHIVIKNAELFDPLLMPLLNREFMRKGARLLVNLGSGDIDVASGFKLTLHCKDINSVKQNRPLLLAKVNLIDFRMTESVFEEMIGDALLNSMKPELAEKRQKLQKVSVTTKKKLRNLETDLLSALSSSAGNLLENHQLVHSLETLKSESVQLSELQATTSSTLNELNVAYEEFAPTAKKAAEVYLNALSYQQLDPFYRIGVDYLWQVAKQILSNTEINTTEFITKFESEIRNRIASVVKTSDCPANATKLSLSQIIYESNGNTPVIAGLTTTNAMDPTTDLLSVNNQMQTIAMGSKQSTLKALQLIDEGIESGDWVSIQNIEIAGYDFFKQLSSRLQQPTHTDFRLILTGLQNELVLIPDLIASGRPVCVERVHGIKANMQLIKPMITSQELLTLAWIHATFTEAFPKSNFSKLDFESVGFIYNQLHSTLSLMELQTAILSTVWQAKSTNSEDRLKMDKFTKLSFENTDLQTTDYDKFISKLPDDTKWIPSTFI